MWIWTSFFSEDNTVLLAEHDIVDFTSSKWWKRNKQPHVAHAQIRFHFANDFILLKILRIVITKKLHKTDSLFTYLDNLDICLHRLCYMCFQIHLMFRNYLWNYNWFGTFLLLLGHFASCTPTLHMTSPGFPVPFASGLTSWIYYPIIRKYQSLRIKAQTVKQTDTAASWYLLPAYQAHPLAAVRLSYRHKQTPQHATYKQSMLVWTCSAFIAANVDISCWIFFSFPCNWIIIWI